MMQADSKVGVPGATYRLQFHAGFTFAHAERLIDYLHALGITHVYASPIFTAGPGSAHGYDTCSHSEISPAFGGSAAFEQLAAGLRRKGMALLLDIVPNHMGACSTNAWWWDVLKNGRQSRYASFFDIRWEGDDPLLRNKVLLPVLGEPLGEAVRQGKLRTERERDGQVIAYYDQRFPLSPNTPSELLAHCAANPERNDPNPTSKAEPSPPANRAAFLRLLDQQHYRLAHWRVGPQEINYRRFFDVTGLVAVRMEEKSVFDATHDTVAALLRGGSVTGLRVDHPDGLLDPAAYFRRLQTLHVGGPHGGAPYVVVEKILSRDEPIEDLPRNWPVDGTTGYDFLNDVNALFVDAHAERPMTALYDEFIGCASGWHQTALEGKQQVLEMSFVGDVDRLASALKRIARETIDGRDLTWRDLRAAIVEVIASLAVYRTYIPPPSDSPATHDDTSALEAAVSPEDRCRCEQAANEAKKSQPSVASAIDFLHSILTLRVKPRAVIPAARDFVLQFQQLSGPAAAKGIEDTAFYRYNRFVSLNEVGGSPGTFGISSAEFHRRNELRARHWPHSMLATATHDTKRGEDVRARLNVLPEMHEEWRAAVLRWQKLSQPLKSTVNGARAPDANDEYLLYQTLVGAWDERAGLGTFGERIAAYMLKAIRESKRHTSWTDPNQAYESATHAFIERLLTVPGSPFVEELRTFARCISFFGTFNSVAQVLLKITCPGVPDFYQGSELWDLALVDPDNRRPVDFQLRQELLRRAQEGGLAIDQLIAQPDGLAKLHVIQRGLKCRHEHRALFECGAYVPLAIEGNAAAHVCAFARIGEKSAAIVAVPRLVHTLLRGRERAPCGTEVWTDTAIALPPELANRSFRSFLDDRFHARAAQSLALGDLLQDFPAALLVNSDND